MNPVNADNLLSRRMERNGDDAIALRYSSHVETRAELTLTPREPSPHPQRNAAQRGRQQAFSIIKSRPDSVALNIFANS